MRRAQGRVFEPLRSSLHVCLAALRLVHERRSLKDGARGRSGCCTIVVHISPGSVDSKHAAKPDGISQTFEGMQNSRAVNKPGKPTNSRTAPRRTWNCPATDPSRKLSSTSPSSPTSSRTQPLAAGFGLLCGSCRAGAGAGAGTPSLLCSEDADRFKQRLV